MIDFSEYDRDGDGNIFVKSDCRTASRFTVIYSFLYIHPNHDINMAKNYIHCNFIHEEIQGKIHNLAYVGWI